MNFTQNWKERQQSFHKPNYRVFVSKFIQRNIDLAHHLYVKWRHEREGLVLQLQIAKDLQCVSKALVCCPTIPLCLEVPPGLFMSITDELE